MIVLTTDIELLGSYRVLCNTSPDNHLEMKLWPESRHVNMRCVEPYLELILYNNDRIHMVHSGLTFSMNCLRPCLLTALEGLSYRSWKDNLVCFNPSSPIPE